MRRSLAQAASDLNRAKWRSQALIAYVGHNIAIRIGKSQPGFAVTYTDNDPYHDGTVICESDASDDDD